jgi:hypothetical protein
MMEQLIHAVVHGFKVSAILFVICLAWDLFVPDSFKGDKP